MKTTIDEYNLSGTYTLSLLSLYGVYNGYTYGPSDLIPLIGNITTTILTKEDHTAPIVATSRISYFSCYSNINS